MKLLGRALLVVGATQLVTCSAAQGSGDKTVQLRQVFNGIGAYRLDGSACRVAISLDPMGGASVLRLHGAKRAASARDVTAVAWLTESVILFSTSPIYGSPGVSVFDCQNSLVQQVVNPVSRNAAYPDGADYFELHAVEPSCEATYYYAPDVDNADFSSIRKDSALRRVDLRRWCSRH